MINPPARAEVNAEMMVWIFHAMDIPMDLQNQSRITGHHCCMCIVCWCVGVC